MLRAFAIETGGATYWIAANDEAEARVEMRKALALDIGTDSDEIEELMSDLGIVIVTDDKLAKLTITSDDPDEEPSETMAHALAAMTGPGVLACSEWG